MADRERQEIQGRVDAKHRYETAVANLLDLRRQIRRPVESVREFAEVFRDFRDWARESFDYDNTPLALAMFRLCVMQYAILGGLSSRPLTQFLNRLIVRTATSGD
jgi:hypothetical protein